VATLYEAPEKGDIRHAHKLQQENKQKAEKALTVVGDQKPAILTLVNEERHELLGEGEWDLRGEVGINVNDEEAGGHLNGDLRDLAIGQDGLDAGGHFWHIKVLDFHEFVEGVVGPHEKDDLPLNRSHHEDGALGADDRVVGAVLGLPDLDEGILLLALLGLLLLNGLQPVHSDVTVAPADAHENSIVLKHGNHVKFRLFFVASH